MKLEIIYQDSYLIGINKPHGLLTHRSKIAAQDDVFALQLLRDQVGQKVYPIHRLDKKTSGALLFALDSETNKRIQNQIEFQSVKKIYHAIVRGYFPMNINVNYPVINARGKTKNAQTAFSLINKTELSLPLGKFLTSRYSLIEARPLTGRMHQIRRHLNHLRYPIIGDRPHGCSKQNRLFKEKWKMTSMMLHALSLEFLHPYSLQKMTIAAGFSEEFQRMKCELELLG